MKAIAAALILPALLLSLVGCARSTDGQSGSAVPAEFRAACGHPGATVVVITVPVTVAHTDCDLTGVNLKYGMAGATVPSTGTVSGNVETFAATTVPTEIKISVDADKNVTVSG